MRESSPRWRIWLLVGLAAGVGAQAAALTWQGLLGMPALPDILADLVLRAAPAPIAARVLDQLQFLAKPLLLIGLIFAQVAVAALGGFAVGRWVDRGRAG